MVTLPLQTLKKQRLLEKARTRPSADVMRCAPVGAANLATAPKLSDFRDMVLTDTERIRLHSEAMVKWMKDNVTKKGGSKVHTRTRSKEQYSKL